MAEKVTKTIRILAKQDKWVKETARKYDVDQSFIIRRALSYYKDKGIKQDKLLRKYAEGEI